jgi:two-component system chemotaxis response regulator CheB
VEKITVLITDDSVVYRSQIREALRDIPLLDIAGAASNGRLALERLSQVVCDLLILDLEMPEMDGIETLKEIRKRNLSCKVLVFSSASKRGAEITMEALRLGASDFITKPDSTHLTGENPALRIQNLLLPKIKALYPGSWESEVKSSVKPTSSNFPDVIWNLFSPSIVVIGSSTGGPTVLENIFSKISGPLKCPIIIVQHMPPIFTATLAERISKLCGIPAKEASHGEVLQNMIYVAPGNYHLRLEGTTSRTVLLLDQEEKINSVRPAVDPLFQTAASIFRNKCLGIVLTGMGADGRDGALSVKEHGGVMIIQEEKSCVVFGMPGAVYAAGAYDKIESPDGIISILEDKIASSSLNRGVL